MRKLVAALGILAVASLLFVQAAVAGEKKSHEMTVTVVSVNMEENTITVKDEKGAETTAPVLAPARAGLKDLKAGAKIVITCQDDDKGSHEGVSAIKAAK